MGWWFDGSVGIEQFWWGILNKNNIHSFHLCLISGNRDEAWPMYHVWPISQHFMLGRSGGTWPVCCHWPNTGTVDVRCPIMFVLTHSYPCDPWFVCSTLRELAVSNLGQLLFCLSITWSRYRNAYRDLWIMSIVICLLVAILFRVYMLTTLMLKPVSWWRHQMKTFATLLALCAGNSPSPVNSPHKSQWRRALMFALICAWTKGSINNQDTGDLRHHHIHYDITVMCFGTTNSIPWLLMP